jgi:hypothetical protein
VAGLDIGAGIVLPGGLQEGILGLPTGLGILLDPNRGLSHKEMLKPNLRKTGLAKTGLNPGMTGEAGLLAQEEAGLAPRVEKKAEAKAK